MKINILFNKVKTLLSSVFEGFLSLIYKESCCVCGCSKDNKILCKNCSKNIEILSGFPQKILHGVEIYSATLYKDNMRILIHRLKFNHKRAVAPILADILFKYYKNIDVEKFQNAVLVPVPTTKRNIKERGYNNVFEVVKCFSKLSKINITDGFLIKTKNTKPQYKTDKNKRKTNIQGSFGVNLKKYKGLENKTLVIVDDIITTGSTLDEIIKTLQENGIKNIICITLSKTV